MLSLIVAAAENNAIGKNNGLLWKLPADMKFFKNTTWAFPVIMGRKTFESLGKPLMGRYNIVVTTQPGWHRDGVETAGSVPEAIKMAELMKTNEIFIIGGGKIYEETLPLADRIYMTRVHTVAEGDTFFPEMNGSEWQLTSAHSYKKDEKHAFDFDFETWDRAGKDERRT